jgi:hypothetical protein
MIAGYGRPPYLFLLVDGGICAYRHVWILIGERNPFWAFQCLVNPPSVKAFRNSRAQFRHVSQSKPVTA